MEQLQPRVVNKLTLCFYPMSTIMPAVTDLTGLDNYNLEGQSQFDLGTVELLQGFLSRLSGPVCLVAHNGHKFDFPLLLAEVKKAGGDLQSSILCVDSYLACLRILQQWTDKQIECEELESLDKLLNEGAFDEDFDENYSNSSINRKTDNSVKILFEKSRISAIENESTPERKNPESSKRSHQSLITSSFKPRKKLFTASHRGPSLALGSLHSRLLGVSPVQSHGAEADCQALMRVTGALGQDWLDYVHTNTKHLADCTPMWNW